MENFLENTYTSKNISDTSDYHFEYKPTYIPNEPMTPVQPYRTYYYYPTIKVKRITKTIEKHDKDGKYKGKKIITTEEEIIDNPVYTYVDAPIDFGNANEWIITSCFNCSNLN